MPSCRHGKAVFLLQSQSYLFPWHNRDQHSAAGYFSLKTLLLLKITLWYEISAMSFAKGPYFVMKFLSQWSCVEPCVPTSSL